MILAPSMGNRELAIEMHPLRDRSLLKPSSNSLRATP